MWGKNSDGLPDHYDELLHWTVLRNAGLLQREWLLIGQSAVRRSNMSPNGAKSKKNGTEYNKFRSLTNGYSFAKEKQPLR